MGTLLDLALTAGNGGQDRPNTPSGPAAEHKAPALTADECARMLDLAARWEMDADDIAIMWRQCEHGFEVDGRRYAPAEARLLWLAHTGSVH